MEISSPSDETVLEALATLETDTGCGIVYGITPAIDGLAAEGFARSDVAAAVERLCAESLQYGDGIEREKGKEIRWLTTPEIVELRRRLSAGRR